MIDVQWIVAGIVLLVYVFLLIFSRSPFKHILLLFALAIIVVQFVADRVSARGSRPGNR